VRASLRISDKLGQRDQTAVESVVEPAVAAHLDGAGVEWYWPDDPQLGANALHSAPRNGHWLCRKYGWRLLVDGSSCSPFTQSYYVRGAQIFYGEVFCFASVGVGNGLNDDATAGGGIVGHEASGMTELREPASVAAQPQRWDQRNLHVELTRVQRHRSRAARSVQSWARTISGSQIGRASNVRRTCARNHQVTLFATPGDPRSARWRRRQNAAFAAFGGSFGGTIAPSTAASDATADEGANERIDLCNAFRDAVAVDPAAT
jgi:hypothetical protein